MNRNLIETYAAGGQKLRQAVEGLSRENLLARPGPGNWSIQELVIHLADSEEIAIDRMKRIITEDNPPLLYADETAYVERLFHDRAIARRRTDALRGRPKTMVARAQAVTRRRVLAPGHP